MGYSFRLTARVLLYAPSHRQESTYHSLCYTSHGALVSRSYTFELLLGNVLFNDALNTFYLRLYGIGHMVKDHTESERGNPLPPHGLLFLISSKGSFICTIPQTEQYIPQPVTPVVEHWLEREIAQWVHPMKDRSDDPSHH